MTDYLKWYWMALWGIVCLSLALGLTARWLFKDELFMVPLILNAAGGIAMLLVHRRIRGAWTGESP
jgi:hypothetical protein